MKPRGPYIALPDNRSGAGTAAELTAQTRALAKARVKGGKRAAASVRAAKRWRREGA